MQPGNDAVARPGELSEGLHVRLHRPIARLPSRESLGVVQQERAQHGQREERCDHLAPERLRVVRGKCDESARCSRSQPRLVSDGFEGATRRGHRPLFKVQKRQDVTYPEVVAGVEPQQLSRDLGRSVAVAMLVAQTQLKP